VEIQIFRTPCGVPVLCGQRLQFRLAAPMQWINLEFWLVSLKKIIPPPTHYCCIYVCPWCAGPSCAVVMVCVPSSSNSAPLVKHALSLRRHHTPLSTCAEFQLEKYISPIKFESHCELIRGTNIPLSLPLPVNLSHE
jgi:hypothetical protein